MEKLQPQPRFPLPAPWGQRELWMAFGLALLLYLLGSIVGGWIVLEMEWRQTPWIGAVLALAQVGLLLPPLRIVARYGNPAVLLGLHRWQWQMLGEVTVMLGLGFCGMMVWGLLLYPLGIQAQEPIVPLFGEGRGALISALLVGGVLAPIVEEVVFRGFLFAGLLKFLSSVPAALGSAALFGALHLQPFAFPVLFLLGILLATLYYRTNSLWPPILMHLTINVVAILVQYLAAEQGLI
ncbi:MAG: CPBP family intramembrane metalloprotease [Chloroflexota bacterium]|nr:CPBP family intramembrane metalloprotease [Chloroflexota bacterium]